MPKNIKNLKQAINISLKKKKQNNESKNKKGNK